MNIAQFFIDRKVLTWTMSLTIFAVGVSAYQSIGRLEDPEYTIKTAQVVTYWPGATAAEVASELTDPLETAIQQMGQVKRVTSTSYAGRSIIAVEMQDQYDKNSLPQVWDELRRKVNDNASSLPSGCAPPIVVDSFGDVYGMYYVIYGDGYSLAELKDYAKMLRRELLLCDQVAKIEMIGDQSEVVYFEISRARLANLGISLSEIKTLVSGQNDPAESGHLTIGDKYVRIDPTGKLAQKCDVKAVDALALAQKAGSDKAVNTVLMGVLSRYMPEISEDAWLDAIEKLVKPKFVELNKQAFLLGKNA